MKKLILEKLLHQAGLQDWGIGHDPHVIGPFPGIWPTKCGVDVTYRRHGIMGRFKYLGAFTTEIADKLCDFCQNTTLTNYAFFEFDRGGIFYYTDLPYAGADIITRRFKANHIYHYSRTSIVAHYDPGTRFRLLKLAVPNFNHPISIWCYKDPGVYALTSEAALIRLYHKALVPELQNMRII